MFFFVVLYLLTKLCKYSADDVHKLSITVQVVHNSGSSLEQFTFDNDDVDLEITSNKFCGKFDILVSTCGLLLERAIGKQIEYLQQKQVDEGFKYCDRQSSDHKCIIRTQYIANPHLHRSVHALSSEIKSNHKSNDTKTSVLTREREVINQIIHDMQYLFTINNAKRLTTALLIIKPPQITFIHSCSIPGEQNRILNDMLEKMALYGLTDSLDKVYVLNYGLQVNSDVIAKYVTAGGLNKVVFIHVSNDTSHFEIPTLRIMHTISRHFTSHNHNSDHTINNFHILYLHTKGVSYSTEYPQIADWRNMMLYFLVEQHTACYHLLASGLFDCLGANYKSMGRDFRGNFWWTTSRYLNTLPALSLMTSGKYEAEQWLLNSNIDKNHRVRVFNWHESEQDHHFQRYERDKYVISATANGVNKEEEEEEGSGGDNRIASMECFAKTVFWKQ